jgi:hypothetical protein
MVAANSAPSEALLEANRRLHQLRTAFVSDATEPLAQAARVRVGGSAIIAQMRSPADSLASARFDLKSHVVDLPDHLGWESATVSRAIRDKQWCRSDGSVTSEGREHVAESSTCVPAEDKHSGLPDGASVKLYPDIALGMLHKELAAAGRLWLLLRYLDQAGQGWLRIDLIRRNLVQKESDLRICGQRQLRNLLKQGRGIFWQQDKDRIWLKSAAKVAGALEVERLTGRPVDLPVEVLLGGIGQVRAHFYASFHSGRRSRSPISRAKVEQLTGVPARTQRIYDTRSGVTSQRNIAIGESYSVKEVQERAWRHGQGFFEFIDVDGLHGPAGKRYVAWQLPNSYEGCHETNPKGRQKKINRQIDLVNIRAQGNGLDRETSRQQVGRLFFPNGLEAGKSYNRDGQNDAYWPSSGPGFTVQSAKLWHVVAGRGC